MLKLFASLRVCKTGEHEVIHQFLCMPDFPVSLLGRDLLAKLKAKIDFREREMLLRLLLQLNLTLTVAWEEEWRLYDEPV